MRTRTTWLTPRECEVLLELATGDTYKALAPRLGISANTARNAAQRAFEKLDVNDRYAAVARHPRHRFTGRMCNQKRVKRGSPEAD